MEKKLVLPGDHLSSAEEAEPGENTYLKNDEIYAAAPGKNIIESGIAQVKSKGRAITLPYVDMPVYCMVIKSGVNKATCECMPVEEVEGDKRGIVINAILPVTAIRNKYVKEIRDEVRIGDIIKARISKIEKNRYEIAINPYDCGVVASFCPRCRKQMKKVKGDLFICPACGWKDRKKVPLAEGTNPSAREPLKSRKYARDMQEKNKRNQLRRYKRRRYFGRKAGPGGRGGSY